ncbi:MAG: cyclic nucleotide-binding domain-containing protein [bacterium]
MDLSLETVAEHLRATGRFTLLDPAALEALVAQAEIRALAPGEVFLREGEAGDALYLILEGSVQVFRDPPEGQVVLARLHPGDHLGEQALLPGGTGRRNASARAAEPAAVLRVRRETFLAALADADGLAQRLASAGRARLLADLTAQSELFQALATEVDFAEAVEEVSVPPGGRLMREGEPADALYLITSGIAGIYRRVEGREVQVGQAGAGECVGELGLVSRNPRAATVTAETFVKALRLSGDWFTARYAGSDTLKAWFGTLEGAYRLPRRGLVTRHGGEFEGRDAVTNLYHLDDGRQVAVTLVVGDAVLNASQLGARPDVAVGYEAAGTRRTLQLRGDRLVGVTSVGPWAELPGVMERLLDRRPVTAEEMAAFEHGGSLAGKAPTYTDELLCVCLQVPRAEVRRAVRAGCHDVAAVQGRTGCGTVCGGCVPAIVDLLGGRGFLPATIEPIQEHSATVQSFFLRPAEGDVVPAPAGQHVVVRARIDGHAVERAYTISGVDPEGYEITVKREDQGLFSRWLFDRAAHGETVWMLPPGGSTTWTPSDRPVVCFVAGIGATLAMAVVRAAGEAPPAPVVVHQSGRDADGFVFEEELAALAAAGLITRIRRATDVVGRIAHDDVAGVVARWPGADYFVCGPTAYLEEVAAHLWSLGVPTDRVRVEVFEHAGAPPAAPVGALVRTADGYFVRPVRDAGGGFRRALAGLARGTWVALNAPGMSWRVFGKQLNPVLARAESARVAAGIDPAVPGDPGAALGRLALGDRAFHRRLFERLRARYEGNARRARDAALDGRPLPASTPDGDTAAEVIEVDGQPRALYVIRGQAALRTLLGGEGRFDRVDGPLRAALGAGLLSGSLLDAPAVQADRELADRSFGPLVVDRLLPALEATLRAADAGYAHVAAHPGRPIDLTDFRAQLALSLFFRTLATDVDPREFANVTDDVRADVDALLDLARVHLRGEAVSGGEVEGPRARLRARMGRFIGLVRAQAAGRLPSALREHPPIRLILDGVEPDARIVDRLLPYAIAGHETTGPSLAWLLWELAGRTRGGGGGRGGSATFRRDQGGRALRPADYHDRPVGLAAIHEALRLHPHGPAGARGRGGDRLPPGSRDRHRGLHLPRRRPRDRRRAGHPPRSRASRTPSSSGPSGFWRVRRPDPPRASAGGWSGSARASSRPTWTCCPSARARATARAGTWRCWSTSWSSRPPAARLALRPGRSPGPLARPHRHPGRAAGAGPAALTGNPLSRSGRRVTLMARPPERMIDE